MKCMAPDELYQAGCAAASSACRTLATGSAAWSASCRYPGTCTWSATTGVSWRHARCYPGLARYNALMNEGDFKNILDSSEQANIPYKDGSGDIGPGWFPHSLACPQCFTRTAGSKFLGGVPAQAMAQGIKQKLGKTLNGTARVGSELIRAEMWSRGSKTDIFGLEAPPPEPEPEPDTQTEIQPADPDDARQPSAGPTPEHTPEKKKKEKKKKEKPELTAEELEALRRANEEATRLQKEPRRR